MLGGDEEGSVLHHRNSTIDSSPCFPNIAVENVKLHLSRLIMVVKQLPYRLYFTNSNPLGSVWRDLIWDLHVLPSKRADTPICSHAVFYG